MGQSVFPAFSLVGGGKQWLSPQANASAVGCAMIDYGPHPTIANTRLLDWSARPILLQPIVAAGSGTDYFAADGTYKPFSGASPAGSGTELQYRNGSSFGAVTGSSVSDGNLTTVAIYNSSSVEKIRLLDTGTIKIQDSGSNGQIGVKCHFPATANPQFQFTGDMGSGEIIVGNTTGGGYYLDLWSNGAKVVDFGPSSLATFTGAVAASILRSNFLNTNDNSKSIIGNPSTTTYVYDGAGTPAIVINSSGVSEFQGSLIRKTSGVEYFKQDGNITYIGSNSFPDQTGAYRSELTSTGFLCKYATLEFRNIWGSVSFNGATGISSMTVHRFLAAPSPTPAAGGLDLHVADTGKYCIQYHAANGIQFFHNAVEKMTLTAAGLTAQYQTLSVDPVSADIPSGSFRVVKNITSGTTKTWINDGGTMKASPAFT